MGHSVHAIKEKQVSSSEWAIKSLTDEMCHTGNLTLACVWDVSQHRDDDDNDPMYNGDQVDHRHQRLCVGQRVPPAQRR